VNIEIKDDSTYTFTFTKIVNGLPSDITSATIALFSPSGSGYLAAVAMDIASNVATKEIDFSDDAGGAWSLDQNYKAVMIIDGVTYVRLFDVVRYPFVNEVTQVDLENENAGALIGKGLRVSGKASAGTVGTLTDSRLIGIGSLKGGQLEIFSNFSTIASHNAQITAHDTTTGVLTFTPVRVAAVSTENYSASSSFDNQIEQAGEIVCEQLWMQERRPYLIIDNSQVKRMIIYKFFSRLFAQNRRSMREEDVDHVNYLYYDDLYMKMWKLPLRYDRTNDGNIAKDEERDINRSVRIIR
jgi:hypothetical protein